MAGRCVMCLLAVIVAGTLAADSCGQVRGKVAVPKGTLREFVEPPALARATPEQKALYVEVKKGLLAAARKAPLVMAENSEAYFSLMAHRMEPLMHAYAYSRDPEYIEALVPLIESVLSQRYRHPTKPKVWSGWWHYKNNSLYYMPMHGAILYYRPALLFTAAVRADPKLKAKYGKLAETWYKDITEVEIPAWDKRGTWHDLGTKGGYYTHTAHFPDPQTGELMQRTDLHQGSTLAYNKVHTFVNALCLLYRMTGEGWYRERIEKCERFFRSNWRIKADHIEWNYRDFTGPWDYKNGRSGPTKTGYWVHPKGGYYASDLGDIMPCYDIGLVFTKNDMEGLVKTNLEFMWMGDDKNPKFRKINGTYQKEGKYGKGYLWTALSRFSPKVRTLWKSQLESRRGRYGWANSALAYLIATSRPISWAPRHVQDIPKKRQGAQK